MRKKKIIVKKNNILGWSDEIRKLENWENQIKKQLFMSDNNWKPLWI